MLAMGVGSGAEERESSDQRSGRDKCGVVVLPQERINGKLTV